MLVSLITFLVAIFVLDVSGGTLPQIVNSTSLTTLGDGPSKCNWIYFSDPNDSCICFGGKGGDYGIDRGYMIDAIIQACNELTGGVGEAVAVYGRDEGLVGGERDIYMPAIASSRCRTLLFVLTTRAAPLFPTHLPSHQPSLSLLMQPGSS